MNTNDPRRPRRRQKKSLLALLVIGALLLLAFLLRNCIGLGKGQHDADHPPTPPNPVATISDTRDAGASANVDAGILHRACDLFLSDKGLQLNGQPSTIAAAVVACRTPGIATLRVTGDALTGTYDELISTFKEAGITIAEEPWK